MSYEYGIGCSMLVCVVLMDVVCLDVTHVQTVHSVTESLKSWPVERPGYTVDGTCQFAGTIFCHRRVRKFNE